MSYLFHTFFGQTLAFMQLFLRILSEMANSDQTAPDLGLHCLLCHFVRNLRKHIGLTKVGRKSGVVVISCGRNSGILLYFKCYNVFLVLCL